SQKVEVPHDHRHPATTQQGRTSNDRLINRAALARPGKLSRILSTEIRLDRLTIPRLQRTRIQDSIHNLLQRDPPGGHNRPPKNQAMGGAPSPATIVVVHARRAGAPRVWALLP